MPFKEKFENVPCMKITKRLGRPQLFGWVMFGWSLFGDSNEACGVYQQRRRRAGNYENWHIADPKPLDFFQKPAWPINPQYENQQIWRGSFADAVAAWQALTAEQKMAYNRAATKMSRCGYHLFISKYLKSL